MVGAVELIPVTIGEYVRKNGYIKELCGWIFIHFRCIIFKLYYLFCINRYTPGELSHIRITFTQKFVKRDEKILLDFFLLWEYIENVNLIKVIQVVCR